MKLEITNILYGILIVTAMLIPFYNLYQLLVAEINPITTIIIWQVVVAALFFIEIIRSAIKDEE